jgi:hypothetical protein
VRLPSASLLLSRPPEFVLRFISGKCQNNGNSNTRRCLIAGVYQVSPSTGGVRASQAMNNL